ncbi:MAG TPA: hypothetical protein VHV09_24175 [Trebonia sp.]|jgi:hypothetical protein|nr:hypothetical protein [Trebonia sp.]
MSESRQHIVDVLRRAGMTEVAADAQQTLPDPVERPELDHFCRVHDLSAQSLMERLGSSP